MICTERGAIATTWPILSSLMKGDCLSPFSPKIMATIDHINIYNARHNINNRNRMKHQSLLSRGIGSRSRSIVTTITETHFTWWLGSKTLKWDIKACIHHPYPYADVAPTITNVYKVTKCNHSMPQVKKFSLIKFLRDLVMTCHALPLIGNKRKCLYPALVPSHPNILYFKKGWVMAFPLVSLEGGVGGAVTTELH